MFDNMSLEELKDIVREKCESLKAVDDIIKEDGNAQGRGFGSPQ
jgi:hypothetical protein